MYCKNCGKEISDGVRFCPNCGADLSGGNDSEKTDEQLYQYGAGKDTKNNAQSDASQSYQYQTAKEKNGKKGKKKGGKLKWVLIIVGIVVVLFVMCSMGDDQSTQTNDNTETGTESTEQETTEETTEKTTERETKESETETTDTETEVSSEASLPYTYDDIQFVTLYITQRLTTTDDNDVIDAIKRITGGYEATGSYWVAYECEWDTLLEDYYPDYDGSEYVLYSSDSSPFPKDGAYDLALVDTGETKTLEDSRGFQTDCPVLNILKQYEIDIARNAAMASEDTGTDWSEIEGGDYYDENGNIIDINHDEGATDAWLNGKWETSDGYRIIIFVDYDVDYEPIVYVYESGGNLIAEGTSEGYADIDLEKSSGVGRMGNIYINSSNQLIWFQNEGAAPIVFGFVEDLEGVNPLSNGGNEDNNSSVYLLPESDSHYYTADEIFNEIGLTQDQLRYARNEIYARHGRIFGDQALSSYFNSQPWYNGYVSSDAFDESVFNEYEKFNIDLLKSLEN